MPIPEGAIARFRSEKDGVVRGGGIRVDSGELLTVSHVLNLAVGAELRRSNSRVGEEFAIDFPLNRGATSTAKVTRWQPPKPLREDVATLTPDADGPRAVLDPSLELNSGDQVSVMGFPPGQEEGLWVGGTLAGRLAGGWWQLNSDQGGELAVGPGFSGCPVWRGDRLVGLVWGGRVGTSKVFMIPIDLLAVRRNIVDTTGGSGHWRLEFVLTRLLTSLLNDLVGLERNGLQPEQCEVVQGALGRLNNELSTLDSSTVWERQPSEAAAQLTKTYVDWNNHKGGPEGAHRRSETLGELRNQRRGLQRLAQYYRSTLFEERLTADADRMVDHFRTLPKVKSPEGKVLFPDVQKALGQYRKRADSGLR